MAAVTSRDALRHTLGVTTQFRWRVGDGRAPARLTLSVSAQRNDADGRNFEFEGALGTAQLELPLLPPRPQRLLGDLQLQVMASVLDVDYEAIGGLPKRRELRWNTTAGVSAMLGPLGRLDLSYTHLDIGSNQVEHAARRNLVRLGLTHSF